MDDGESMRRLSYELSLSSGEYSQVRESHRVKLELTLTVRLNLIPYVYLTHTQHWRVAIILI